MAEPFSTNELFLRSDRIAFGNISPGVAEQTLILPDVTGSKLFFGLSSLVSTSGLTGTLEAIYPNFASFTFDNLNSRLGINVSTPQYAIDISTTTGVRIQGGSLIANATGLVSVPTASLFSTLPTYVFAPGTIPVTAIASTGGSVLPGVSVPTSALFSTLPTSVFAPSSIPLVALQSTGIIVASSFVGSGFFLSNIPLANINGTITGDFFRPNSIPLSTLASTGQIWIREPTGSIFAPIISTAQLLTSSLVSRDISTINLTTNRFLASSIQANYFESATFAASNISAINIKASSLEVLCMVSTGRFFGDGQSITNLTPAFLNNVIPSDKFGYRLIAIDAINPYGNWSWESGTITFKQAAPLVALGDIRASSFHGGVYFGDGRGLYNLNSISTASLVSTVVGLGTVGYVSSPSLTSSLVGLGSINYVSTASLVSTTIGLSHSGYISSTQLNSTVEGLGSLGYVSSTQLASTVEGLATASYISSTQLNSTLTGLATLGFVSSTQLMSTVGGLASAFYVSTTQLNSTVTGLASASYISSTQLNSTLTGLATLGFVSSSQLASTVYTIESNAFSTSMGNTTQLLSSLTGLGSLGYISSTQLASTVRGLDSQSLSTSAGNTSELLSSLTGLATLGYVSSSQLVSTVASLNSNTFSTSMGNATELLSSFTGLGSLGYVSSTQLNSSLTGLATLGFVSSSQLVSTVIAVDSNLLSTSVGNTSELASSLTGLATLGYVSSLQLTSTVKGLGSAFYISSAQLVSTVGGLEEYISSFIDPTELTSTIVSTVIGLGLNTKFTSTVEGLGSSGYVSSLSLVSTTVGLQTSGFLSSPNLLSTVEGLGSSGYVSTSYLDTAFSTFSTAMGPGADPRVMASTLEGLGTFGYVSSLSLVSTTQGLEEYVSSFIDPSELASSILPFISSTYFTTSLVSTVEGLGSAGYVSSLSLQSSILAVGDSISSVSTSYGLVFQTSSLTTNVISSLFLTADNIIARYSLFVEDGTLSAVNLTGLSPTTLTLATSNIDLVTAMGTGADIQWNMTVYDADRHLAFYSKNTDNDVLTLTSTGLVGIGKTPKLNLDISGTTMTTYLDTLSISTGSVYVSTLNLYDLSTASVINELAVSSGILYLNGQMIQGGGGDVTTARLISTVEGLGTVGYISSPQLISTTDGIITAVVGLVNNLGTYGYVSTATLEAELSSFSTALGVTGGLTTLPSSISTFALLTSSLTASTITVPYISAMSLWVCTINGAPPGSGSGGITSLPSTISTFSLLTSSIQASTINTIILNASTGLLSSFSTNNINFAGGFGYLTMPDIYPNTVFTSTVTASNLLVGWNSVVSPIQFYGFGTYSNSVIAELSTGATTQELLVFRGSNATDRIRMQTTGSIVFEPGVSARVWPTAPSNVTPAMVINTSSNIGIQTASPTVPLDVAGAIRAVSFSTQQITTSSILGPARLFGATIASSFTMLGPSTFLVGGFSTSFMTAGFQEIDFYTNGIQRMTILSNGNVGVGMNPNPNVLFDVAGTGEFSSILTSSLTSWVTISTVDVKASSILGVALSSVSMGASTFTGKWNDAQYYVLQTI